MTKLGSLARFEEALGRKLYPHRSVLKPKPLVPGFGVCFGMQVWPCLIAG